MSYRGELPDDDALDYNVDYNRLARFLVPQRGKGKSKSKSTPPPRD